ARSIEEVGATPNRVEVEPIEARASNPDDYAAILTPMLAGATATLFLAPVRPSGALSFAIINIAQSVRARHLHLLQVDERLLGQSFRADPEPLAIINERLCTAVKPPCIVRVSSDAGTDLELRLAAKHPLLSSSGRPPPGV